MEPQFSEGDHVLTFNWIEPKVRDVVVFKKGSLYLIKRIKKVLRHKIKVGGDNRASSTNLGPIAKYQIIGKVILKY